MSRANAARSKNLQPERSSTGDEMVGTTLSRLEGVLDKAKANLLSRQTPNGDWEAHNRMSVSDTARTILVEHYAKDLDGKERQGGEDFLLNRQRADGSWTEFDNASEGGLDATCLAYAGLKVLGVEDAHPKMTKALKYIELSGGFKKARVDVKPFLAMAEVIDAKELMPLPTFASLFPKMNRFTSKYFASWASLGGIQLAPLTTALKRGGEAPHPVWNPISFRSYKASEKKLKELQNPEGDWYGTSVTTTFGLAALTAMGVPKSDPSVQKGLQALDRLKLFTAEGMEVVPFTSEVWDTATVTETLTDLGQDTRSAAITRARDYLVGQQAQLPTPLEWQNPDKGDPRVGGWGFEEGNQLAPDCDTTGATLTALRRAPKTPESEAAIKKGLDWLWGMQNKDGGWSAWSQNQPSKKPGAMEPNALLKKVMPALMTDPSTEGLTGRILECVGGYGFDVSNPQVAKAVEFIKSQQTEDGSWWGRWAVNYTAGTSFALGGLMAAGVSPEEPYVAKALNWLEQQQNSDGGWGESEESYFNDKAVGPAKSGAMLTGVALRALAMSGRADGESAHRAAKYLIENQDPDGGWTDEACMGVGMPSLKQFYSNDLFTDYYPLRGLEAYHRKLG